MRTQSPPSQHKRPRGLWRGRRGAASSTCVDPKLGRRSHDVCSDPADTSASASTSSTSGDTFDDDFDDDHSSDSSCKRRRLSHALSDSDTLWHRSPSSRALTPDLLYHAPCFPSQILSPPPYPAHNSYPFNMFPIADKFSSINCKAKGKQPTVSDLEDWENLKELFARATESFESDDFSEALPLLRAVIRECHRFLLAHPDPSRVYAEGESSREPSLSAFSTPLDERPAGDWSSYFDTGHRPHKTRRPPQHTDPPTAFHTIFGTALFLMGTAIAQDSSLALPDEPSTASAYWLAALDVFETGENLPSVVSSGSPPREDWRMAVSWGRTLVCLAEEKVEATIRASNTQAQPPPPFQADPDPRGNWGSYMYQASPGPFASAEPRWPRHSPFHAIAAARPPVTRRMSLYSASAHDVLVLAMDQFSRGIFHMPHPHYPPTHNPTTLHHESPFIDGAGFSSTFYQRRHTSSTSPPPSTISTGSGAPSPFSRPKELFTIASEVLGVAERLAQASQREYWAAQADSVFNQMRMEADMSEWRMAVNAARGRCWLVVGAARAEEMEPALDRGDMSVLHSVEAKEAREGLAMAITFFERAKGSATVKPNPEQEDLSPLLAEALINLANLTADDHKREELYSRAQTEGGADIDLELDPPATALPASISSIAASAKPPTMSASEVVLRDDRKQNCLPDHNPILAIEASPSFVFSAGTKRSFSFSSEGLSAVERIRERDVPMVVDES